MEQQVTLVTIMWPDTKQIEEGVELKRTDTEIYFRSLWDGSINWVPAKLEVK